MFTSKKLFATLGVGAIVATGLLAAGSTPAKADGLRISDHNGRVGFSLNIGTPQYYAPVVVAPVCAPPVYVAPAYYPAPVYVAPADYNGRRDDHARFDRNRDSRGGRDRR